MIDALRQNRMNQVKAGLCLTLLVASVSATQAAPAKTDSRPSVHGVPLKPITAPVPGAKLQGSAQMLEMRDPHLEAWRASQLYSQGAWYMTYNDLRNAAECFRQSGDAWQASVGECRFLAEARFAEAQSYRLMGQIPKSAKLFQLAADVFRRADPYNPYLQAALGNLRLMGFVDRPVVQQAPAPKPQAPKPRLVALTPRLDSITPTLKASLTKLEDGTEIAALHDQDFFDGSKKRMLAQAAACDLSDKFIKGALHDTFIKMTCLEFAALGANYETVGGVYKPFTANGKPVIIGAADDVWSPTVRIDINGKEYPITMDLPGIAKYSRNVMLMTNGQQVVAVDPRKNDIWKLVPVFNAKGGAEFNWWKLTHTKKGVKTSKT